jgi:hypothetical protein
VRRNSSGVIGVSAFEKSIQQIFNADESIIGCRLVSDKLRGLRLQIYRQRA